MDRPRRPPSEPEPEPEPDPIYDTIPSEPPPDVIRERRRASRPSGRFFVDPKAEASVVDEWASSIAAEASRARASDPVIKKLPTPTPPPIILVPEAPPSKPLDPSEILDTLPVPRKRRPSSTPPPVPTAARTEGSPPRASSAVASAPAPAPTVVVRPRASWLVAAAVVGALIALGAMRLVALLLP